MKKDKVEILARHKRKKGRRYELLCLPMATIGTSQAVVVLVLFLYKFTRGDPDVEAFFVTIGTSQAVIVLVLFLYKFTRGDPDVEVHFVLCNGVDNNPESDYQAAVNRAGIELVSNTHLHGYNYYRPEVEGGVPCYGHARCFGQIFQVDCHTCLMVAVKEWYNTCLFAAGVEVELEDCSLRFEAYVFND